MVFTLLDTVSLVSTSVLSNPDELVSDPTFAIGLILIGLMVGIAIGLSGLGGAPLLLPSLVLIGIPPQIVIGADLAFIFGTKLFASILHGKERNINWKALVFLLIPVVPVMLFASWVWTGIKENYGSDILDTVILLLLGTILIGISLYMIKNNVLKKNNLNVISEHPTTRKFTRGEKTTFLGASSIISFITQITATGAGAMTLPLLIKKCHCPPKHVAGTSVLFGVAISAVGTILHYNMGNVPFLLVLFLLIGSIPGVFLGVKLTSKISPRKLIATFSIIILIAAIFLLNRGFGII
ncbi:MAG: sulfite exporter TauE/SafE family protein [Nitrosopumilus sp.]|nr:sulfite exporter TauE/SafE family protein [Nitrosopumilus sp.]MDH3517088.1 sulfite exporter TauE/SafE family protein [Nitrosopumilus sp.]MDH3564214.1 sulfite exporter TauE/SafE family protein [Nitrosopumilus sp.]MDH5417898.1 sulfite exporter TauE/SafE family protein [Nitrosopumilus sp.]MDH5554486.1 sulfite exporter TauE/SafE family protein [Nitrosopumilus sp.]